MTRRRSNHEAVVEAEVPTEPSIAEQISALEEQFAAVREVVLEGREELVRLGRRLDDLRAQQRAAQPAVDPAQEYQQYLAVQLEERRKRAEAAQMAAKMSGNKPARSPLDLALMNRKRVSPRL